MTSFFEIVQWIIFQYLPLKQFVDLLYFYIDVDYALYVIWLIYPLLFCLFILPFLLILAIYASAIFLHIFRLRHIFIDSYPLDPWESARKFLAVLWDAQGKIWHGYEINGIENIPADGPALIIYYHATIPLDIYYLIAKCILIKNRSLWNIGDKFLFKIPGFKLMLDVFYTLPGTVDHCVDLMKKGHILSIAPGGVREALFSDEYYSIMWGKRVGFAKIAIEAKVPVIPMFTENCREAFRTVGFIKSWFRSLYEWSRLPLVPIYGGFPVKLRTHIGEPIPYVKESTPEELALKVQHSIQQLINKHQRRPGRIFYALLQRFSDVPISQ